MDYGKAKEEFIQSWGALGSSWGINRTMSSIHALLMASNKPLSTEEIMEALTISRGNANMNTRALIDWGLVKKHRIAGDRKEYFVAGKDVWEIARQIIKERRKRELLPVIETLKELNQWEGQNTDEEQSFKKLISDLFELTQDVSSVMEVAEKKERSWLGRTLFKLIRWFFICRLLSLFIENIKMLNNITYALYLSLGIPVVFFLGRHLHHEGAIFFEGLKHFREDEIKRYNNLLLIGFYLLNMGYTVLP